LGAGDALKGSLRSRLVGLLSRASAPMG
jgi:hypothetical protein